MKQTPLDSMPPALPYEPVRCKQPKCNAVLNAYWCVARVGQGARAHTQERRK
jgi:hypothetical protein